MPIKGKHYPRPRPRAASLWRSWTKLELPTVKSQQLNNPKRGPKGVREGTAPPRKKSRAALAAQSDHRAVQPPSTDRVVPVICAAESEHKNTAVPPNCSTVANSFDGWRVSITSRIAVSRSMPYFSIVSGI